MRFWKCLSFILVLLIGLESLPVFAGPSLNGDITRTCSLTVSAAKGKGYLTDQNVNTHWSAAKNGYVRITSKQEIGGLYIIWDTLPASWTLKSGGENLLIGGLNHFLHEYQALTTPVKEVVISLDGGDASIAEIYVLGKENVPAWVQRWNPPYTKADMLLVSTHPDDEHLWFGGAMPVYAAFGKKVQVAYLINSGKRRANELLNGLWAVGITAYPVLGPFPDIYVSTLKQALGKYKEDEVINYQVGLLRRFRPEVVLGHDLNGEYGHGAHRLNSYTLTKALSYSGDASKYPDLAAKYGTWQVKKCYLHLYENQQILMDWSQPLSFFNGKTGLDMAKEGFFQHTSQYTRGRYHVAINVKYDCRLFGLYFSSVGADVKKNDFFENIAPVIPWAPLPFSAMQVITKPMTATRPVSGTKATTTTTASTTQSIRTTAAVTTQMITTSTSTQLITTPTAALAPVVEASKNTPPDTGFRYLLVAIILLAGGVIAFILVKKRR